MSVTTEMPRTAIDRMSPARALSSGAPKKRRQAKEIVSPNHSLPAVAPKPKRKAKSAGLPPVPPAPPVQRFEPSGGNPIILEIIELHRQRKAAIRTRIAMIHPCLALLRGYLGLHHEMTEAERKKVCEEAAKVYHAVSKSKIDGLKDEKQREVALFATPIIKLFSESAKTFDKWQDEVDKKIAKLAEKLPVAPWVETVRGFGISSLATVIGEAGNLSNYSNPGKLWKRFGLSPVRGKAGSTWKMKNEGSDKLSVDEWVALGYVGSRNAVTYILSDNQVKGGHYRPLYDERKAYELARDPEMKPIVAHLRAKRYVAKRLLRDLWRAWRDAAVVKQAA